MFLISPAAEMFTLPLLVCVPSLIVTVQVPLSLTAKADAPAPFFTV